ncbi:MAG: DUF1254 domain-containing protein [Rhodoferax sp.]
MKPPTTTQRLWGYRILTLIATAVLVHLGAIWAAPRLVMAVLLHGPQSRELNMHNQAAYPPPVDASARRVVMPSPDLLYSVCAFDLRQGPLRIQAHPQLDNYWSIALYAANSDNFFVLNDRQAGAAPVDLWLVADAGNTAQAAPPPGARVVVSPSATGMLLMRLLTTDYAAEKERVEAARHTLRCESAPH